MHANAQEGRARVQAGRILRDDALRIYMAQQTAAAAPMRAAMYPAATRRQSRARN